MVSIPQRELDELRKDLDDLRGQQDRERLDAYAKNHALRQDVLRLEREVETASSTINLQRLEINVLRSNLAIADGYIQRCLEDDAMRERGDKAERMGPDYRINRGLFNLDNGNAAFDSWALKMAAE